MSSKENKKLRITAGVLRKKLALPFVLLSLAGYGVVQAAPLLTEGGKTDRPELWQLTLVGVGIILISALFLSYVAKLIGLMRGWLALGVLFTSFMVVTKFILVPDALYSQTFRLKAMGSFNPNQAEQYTTIGVLLFLFYALIFFLAYRYFAKGTDKTTAKLVKAEEFGVRRSGIAAILVILGVIGLAASGGGAILLLPMLYAGSPMEYLNYAFTGGGPALILMAAMTIILSIAYLNHASNKAVEIKNATILATTFWVGLSLLLVYHVLWVIYMTVLLSLWPFKVISPSGK